MLDDQSTDQTRRLLTKLAVANTRLRVLDGLPASGQLSGKVWACTQLAQQAKENGFDDLRRSGLVKVMQGVTSLAEANRVTTGH